MKARGTRGDTVKKRYPQLIVCPAHMQINMQKVVAIADECRLAVTGVSKGFCSIPECCSAMLAAGCRNIGAARIGDLRKLKQYDPDMVTMLTRIPMISEAEEVVRYADISLASDLTVMRTLNEAALQCCKKHNVIVMLDIGDLREGYYDTDEMVSNSVLVERELAGLHLLGIGTNFGCYGSIRPTWEKLTYLVAVAERIEAAIGRRLEVLSVGGTQVLDLVPAHEIPGRINNIRCGICSVTKAPYTWEADIEGRLDTFRLRAEIVEIRDKPSLPDGMMGAAALNEKRVYIDRGIRKRAIVAVGRQDIGEAVNSIIPLEPVIQVLGSSSDHTILDVQECTAPLKVGDCVDFRIDYVACMHLTMSSDVNIKITKCL